MGEIIRGWLQWQEHNSQPLLTRRVESASKIAPFLACSGTRLAP
jgi:hypothetical protein